MTVPTYNIQTEPILKQGRTRLTSREQRMIAGDVLGRHLDTLVTFLKLGFTVVGHKGSEYRLHHSGKKVSAILNVDLNALPKSSRTLIEGFFRREGPGQKSER